jgi:hypothetical protein
MKCIDIEKLLHSAYRDELPNQSVAFCVGGRLHSILLAAIAEFERELNRGRTGEGRKRVMANGIKFGRKPDPHLIQHRDSVLLPLEAARFARNLWL